MTIKSILKSLISQRWNIGFAEVPLESIVNGKSVEYRWLKHSYKNRWFADPFILDVTPTAYIVLVEDYEEKKGYADISRLVVDRRTMEVLEVKTVLSVGNHLSFPFIIRDGDDLYILPENSQSGELNLYRYDKTIEVFVKCKTVLNEALTDAVPITLEGSSYLFATKLPEPNGKDLLIYRKRNGVYEMLDTIHFESRIARMAGSFFTINGQLYRPAQDCNQLYGGAMWIQKMQYKNCSWSFENVAHLSSPHPDYQTGFHTLNVYKGVIVVDVHGYSRHPWLSSALTNLINIFRTLH